MGGLRYVFDVVRRGLIGHTGEIWFVTQAFQSVEPFQTANKLIETNLLGFALIVLAFTALNELIQTILRPDLDALSAACNGDSPMLPFKKDEI